MMPRITIGIPCFHSVSPEVLQDYMRFTYYLGRRYPEYDFFLAIKTKSEQFRARNAIVEAALQVDSKYLLMIDDDHIIDTDDSMGPTEKYDFLRQMVKNLEENQGAGIVGALYYTRGGECRPVLMKEGKDGAFYWMRDDEITHGLQEVAVTGGGCFLFDMNLFSKVPYPWFEPELSLGTDLQICKKAREHSFKVFCDTSIELGHQMQRREVVTSKNRHRIYAESATGAPPQEGLDSRWTASTSLYLYLEDAKEYLKCELDQIEDMAQGYRMNALSHFNEYEDKKEYYRMLGPKQLARQVCFHLTDGMERQFEEFLKLIDTSRPAKGIDYGCGSAPLGFELAMRGHAIDFIDIDGASGYEFTKWRAAKRGIGHRCSFTMTGGPYDYALFMDSIEHLENWKEVLTEISGKLKENGFILTNYFLNADYDNAEHISMDKKAVQKHLVDLGIYPVNEVVWIKRDLTMGGKTT